MCIDYVTLNILLIYYAELEMYTEILTLDFNTLLSFSHLIIISSSLYNNRLISGLGFYRPQFVAFFPTMCVLLLQL